MTTTSLDFDVKTLNIFSSWRETNDETRDDSDVEYLKLFKQFLSELPAWISSTVDHDLTPDLIKFLINFISNWLKQLEMTITPKDLSELLSKRTNTNQEEYNVLNFCRHASAIIVKQDELYMFITRAKTQALDYEYEIKRYPALGKQSEPKTRVLKAIVNVPNAACKIETSTVFTPEFCEELQAMQKTASYAPDNLAEARLPNFLLGWFGSMLHGEPLNSKPTIPMTIWADGEGSGTSKIHPINWRRSIHWETMRMLLRFVIVDAGWSMAVYKKIILWFLTWLLNKEMNTFLQQKSITRVHIKYQADSLREMALKVSRKVVKLADAKVAKKVNELVSSMLSKLTVLHDNMLKDQFERSAIGDLRASCIVSTDYYALNDDWLTNISTELKFATSTPAKAELGHFTILPHPNIFDSSGNFNNSFDVIAYLNRIETWSNSLLSGANDVAKQCAVRFSEDIFFTLTWNKAPTFLSECTPPPTLNCWWKAASPRVSHDKASEITDHYVDALNSFMKTYLKVLASVPKNARQLSRTVLLAFSLTITLESITILSEDGFMDRYRIGLRSSAMNNLVFDEAQEFHVSAGIHKYLDDQSDRQDILFGGKKEVDLEFSAAYVAKDDTLMKIVQEENESSALAAKNYMNEVTRKKDASNKYRQLNEVIQEELKAIVTEERNYIQRQSDSTLSASEKDPPQKESEVKSTLAAKRIEIEAKASEISSLLKEAEELPPPIVNPLPSDPLFARSTIFFIFIPKKFGILSEWTVYTKDLTASGFADKKKSLLNFKLNWDDFFFQYKRGSLSTTRKRDFIGGPKLVFPEEIKFPSDKNVSVIDPQAFKYAIAYRYENSFFELALFGLSENPILNYFAPDEQSVARQLMKLPNNPEEECSRENEILTSQYLMPEYMSKKGWYALGKVRAHKLLQLRQILILLKEKSVPFTEQLVQGVITYALQEIGPFNALASGWRHWKTDMSWESFRDEFASAVLALAEEVGPKSRDHAELILLIDLCAWLNCFTPTILKALTIITRTALTWEAEAEAVASQLIDNPEELENIGLIQQHYRIYGFLALSIILPDLWRRYVQSATPGSEFTAEEISALSAIVRLRAAIAKGETLTPHPTISTLLNRVNDAQAQVGIYLIELLHVNSACTNKILAKAVGATVTLSGADSPDAVVWSQPTTAQSNNNSEEDKKSCYSVAFEAQYGPNKYEINLFNGTILCNGYPISLLPQHILSTASYQRVFGTARFAVQLMDNSHFRSLKAFSNGLCYDFGVSFRGNPIIREFQGDMDTTSDKFTECFLLNNKIFAFFPKPLYENYSHWYCPSTSTIIFREINFRGIPNATNTSFIVHSSYLFHIDTSLKQGVCYRIPSYLQVSCLPDFARNTSKVIDYDQYKADQLFPSSDGYLRKLTTIFTKFEKLEYILIFGDNDIQGKKKDVGQQGGEKLIRQVYLSNFDLSFSINYEKGYIQSEDFRDYRLSDHQSLPDTFLSYEDYLVLESLRPYDTSLPANRFIAHLPDLTTRYAIWHVNRFQQLDAFSIEDRLSLALCYVSSGCREVDRRLHMTGSEYALQLLSRCWSSIPYSAQAVSLIYMIQKEATKFISWLSPTIYLRATYLLLTSDQCAFLYNEQKPNEWEISSDMIFCYDKLKRTIYNIRGLLTPEEEKLLFGCLVEDISTSRIKHSCSASLLWTSLIPTLQMYQSAFTTNNTNKYINYLKNELTNSGVRAQPTTQYPVSNTRFMASYRDMGWMDQIPIIFYSLYEALRTKSQPRLLTQIKGMTVEAYLRGKIYGNYTTQQLFQGLFRILLLVGYAPEKFPSLWFPVPCELPNPSECVFTEQEFSTSMISFLDIPSSTSSTEQTILREKASEEIKVTFQEFRKHFLDSNDKPSLPALFQDIDGKEPLSFQSSCPGCSFNGNEKAWKSIEIKYRKVALAIGVTQFLEAIANVAEDVATQLPDRQVNLYTAKSTTVQPVTNMRSVLLPIIDTSKESQFPNPAFDAKPDIFWSWIDTELDHVLHGPQGKSTAVAINPIRARKEKEQRLKDIQKLFATDITAVTPVMFMEMQTILQELQQMPAVVETPTTLKFPLEEYPASTNMGKEMSNELKTSWLQYKSELSDQEAELQSMDNHLAQISRSAFDTLHAKVHQERMKIETELLQLTNEGAYPSEAYLHAMYSVGTCTGLFATPNLLDILRVYGKKEYWYETMRCALPFVEVDIAKKLSSMIYKLLIYRTYEDKVIRCKGMVGDASLRPALLKELLCRHVERKHHHPLWQLLEVEQGFMIRDVQHQVVEQLLSNSNRLVQLNMGEGKTKVIMPLLVCALADSKRLVRLNILRSLQAEVIDYLSNALGGAIGKRVYTFPFNRAVDLDEKCAEVLVRLMKQCCQEGSVAILAPEHRQSLQLKYMNMLSPNQTKDWSKVIHFVSQVMPSATAENASQDTTSSHPDRIQFLDIMDECDEILKPARQLNYTIGAQTPLDGGSTRWRASMTLLTFLDSIPEITQLLLNPQQVERIPSEKPGAYTYVRLLDPKAVMPAISKALIDALFTSAAPREFGNFKNQSKEWIDAAKRFILNDDLASKEKMEEVTTILHKDSLFRALLVFRGLISFDILEFCLVKRHRVEYGTNRKRKDMRIAVPYVAKDVPSDRNVFGRADVTIILTCLSYYYEGLSYAQLRDTFQSLLDLGPSERNRRYREWLEYSKRNVQKRMKMERNASRAHLLVRQASMINTATIPEITDRIDLTNTIQLQLLYDEFYKNIEVINFFLESRVFPLETQQFPHKLMSTPWDLTESDEVLGFSGTNDNRTTLPLVVQQETLPLLAGTNGKMLELLTAPEYKNLKFVLVDSTWKGILSAILSSDTVVSALLDCGAIMTGVSNREVIKVILKESPAGRFQGGIFTDEKGKMVVRERSGRESYLNNSPIRPADCFVYLTDEFCRGTDLKLAPNAHAVVTLGKDLNKDQLVQTCMRLRQLGQGQTVRFFGTVEIARNICEACSLSNNYAAISSVHVVRWTLENTIRSCEDAMLQWVRQGGLFYKRRKIPHAMYLINSKPHLKPAATESVSQVYSLSVENEVTTLKDMFAGCITTTLCSDAAMSQTHTVYLKIGKTLESFLKNKHANNSGTAAATAKHFWEEWTEHLRQEFSDKSQLLNARTKQYVSHLWISSFVLDEEFEVELEIQAEFQLQRELPIKQETAQELPCQLSIVSLSTLTKISEVLHAIQPIEPVHQVFQTCSNPALQVLQFHSNLFCTTSFRMVLKDPNVAPDWYMKAVDVLLEIRTHTESTEQSADIPENPATSSSTDAHDITHCFVIISGNEANTILNQLWKARWKMFSQDSSSTTSPLQPSKFVNKLLTQSSFQSLEMFTTQGNGVIITFHHLCAPSSCLSLSTSPNEDKDFAVGLKKTMSGGSPMKNNASAAAAKEADARVRVSKLSPLRMTTIELRLFMGQCNYTAEDDLVVRRFLGVLSKLDKETITIEGCKVLQQLGILTGTGYVVDPSPTGEPINLTTYLPPTLQSSAQRIMNIIHRIHREKQVTKEATIAIKTLIQMRGEWIYFSRSTLDDIVSGIR